MSEFDLLGHRVLIEGDSERLGASLRAFWSHPEHRFPQPPEERCITVRELAGPPAAFPATLDPPLELVSGPVPFASDDPVFWLGDPASGLRLTLDAAGGLIEAWGESPSLYEMLLVAVSEVLRVSGLVSLHAAVAARDGQATAFLGPSGRGKTTTLVRAIAAGWSVVSEDFAWLEPESLTVYGLDRNLRLLPDTAQLLVSLVGELELGELRGDKYEVPYERLGLERLAARLSRLALLERDPARPSGWQPVSKREGALALWGASGMPLSQAGRRRAAATLGVLATQLAIEKLILGDGALLL